MKIIFRLLIFILLVLVFSCEKDFVTNCQDCTTEEPVNVELTIYIDYPVSSDKNATISIYEGNLEDSILIESYSIQGRDATYFKALINKKYTVTASYSYGDKTYVAVDSTIPRVRFVSDSCKEPCYYVYNKSLNLKLKYH
jgi:hypothetical protein